MHIDFQQGVTAIVGPNGSGKSNVTDAIRWVLGEQNVRNLRATKNEDIIFSGSEQKKSINYAEVKLCLDDCSGIENFEFDEVVITRRMYRSGESEYLINNNNCRLKDIQQFFLGSGIGKGSYSIIGQGRIEEIIVSQPEERTIFFEEASGIIKHKLRKRESERKLDFTEQSLIRINDIINEVSENLDTLSEQAVAAREYLTLKNKLSQLEVVFWGSKLSKNEKNITWLNNDIAKSTSEIDLHSHTLEDMNSVCTKWSKYIRIYNERLLCFGNESSELDFLKEKINGEINLIQEKIKNIKFNMENNTELEFIRKRIKELAEQEETLNQDIDAFEIKLTELTEKELFTKNKLQNIESEKEAFDNNVEESKNNYFSIMNEMVMIENSFKSGMERKNEIKLKQEKLELHKDKKNNLIELKESEIKSINEKIISITDKNTSIDASKKSFAEKILILSNEQEKLDKTKREKEILAAQLQVRFNEQQRFANEWEGYNEGVKVIMATPEKIFQGGNIYGTVGSLIDFAPEYSLAVESAVGGAIQNIVVDNSATALKAINLLKEKKAGRVTFLPLDTIKIRPRNEISERMKNEGFLGCLVDIVSMGTEFEKVKQYVFGGILVFKDYSSAITFSKNNSMNYKIVTMQGELISQSGAITGGSSSRRNLDIITRKNKITVIEGELASAKEQMDFANKKIQEISESIKKYEISRDNLDTELESNTALINEFKGKLYLLKSEIDSINAEITDKTAEVAALVRDEIIIDSEMADFENKIAESNDKIIEIKELIEKQQNNAIALENEKKKTIDELSEIKIEIGHTSRKINSFRIDLESAKNEIERMTNDEDKIGIIIQDNKIRLQNLETEIENKILIMTNLNSKKDSLVKKIALISDKKNDWECEFTQKNAEKNIIQQDLEEKKERLHKLELKATRINSDNDNMITMIAESYPDLDLGYLIKKAHVEDVEIDESAYAKEINNLKNKISILGNINISAIEEYEEKSQRYNFLLHQKEDMDKAKESLTEVICQLEKQIESRFMQAFIRINMHFQEIFAELFPGGYAELVLIDNEESSDKGVDILIKLPGKRIQHLSLLSGGEKSLTAIALLFAFLKEKASPFVILDEIEAALDDVNIDRFLMMMKKFSEDVQFVVITHQKKTMEKADVLHGVTMQEKGISKIMSVSLNEKVS